MKSIALVFVVVMMASFAIISVQGRAMEQKAGIPQRRLLQNSGRITINSTNGGSHGSPGDGSSNAGDDGTPDTPKQPGSATGGTHPTHQQELAVQGFDLKTDRNIPEIGEPVTTLKIQITEGHHPTVPVQFGSGEQTQRLILDTGSADLVVFDRQYCLGKGSTFHHLNCFNRSVDNYVGKESRIFALSVDGVLPQAYCQEFVMSVKLGSSGQFQADTGVCVANEEQTRYWNGTDGTFGIAFPAIAHAGNQFLLSALSKNSTRKMVGFWFDFENRNGTMDIGGISVDSVDWGETQTFGTPFYHMFPMFHLSICGVDLFSNFSSNWNALVDTGSQMLSLPGEFYDMLLAWLPFECETIDKMLHCKVSRLNLVRMPTLSFQMSETGSKIEIPFSNLLVKSISSSTSSLEPVMHQFGIRKLPYQVGSIPTSMIIVGMAFLESIYTVVDFESQRVGMIQAPGFKKPQLPKGSGEMCASRPTCIGGQTYYEAMNVCLDPVCTRYFFQTLNKERECEVSQGSLIAMAIVIIIFAAVEIYLYEERGKLIQRVVIARDVRQ